jgi:Holliday junction resolvasome RuvABC endonuclease subunit
MGLDLSLRKTGLTVLSEYGNLLCNATLRYPLTRKRGEPPITEAERIERLINLTNEIVGFAKDYKVRYVALEGYAHNKRFQAHQIGEIAGNVKVQLWLARKILVEVIPPSTGRLHFFGYGGAKKDEIYDIVTEKLGIMVDNEDEADSYVVARYLWDTIAKREKKVREI